MADLNSTPAGERLHIAFFGRRNVGKSSLVNAFTGQDLAIVSDVPGTTTDPVYKAMELLPLGPVMIIDTPGIDDVGKLGRLRVERSRQVLTKTDLAVVVTDATRPLDETESQLLALIREQGTPCILVKNKADLLSDLPSEAPGTIFTSAATGFHIRELKELAAHTAAQRSPSRPLVADLLQPGDLVVLVVPIDKAAPKGRLILPQQQTIRAILDAGGMALVCREVELDQTLSRLAAPPKLVITDSQVFGLADRVVPREILLTSFSILMARYKGDLALTVAGVAALDRLRNGDRVLICEGCTHHRQCGDIGTEKLPQWIRAYTGKELEFSFTSGRDFPADLGDYALALHCGGCMLGSQEMACRQRLCADQGVPVTNYGIAIAFLHGILGRALEPFPQIRAML